MMTITNKICSLRWSSGEQNQTWESSALTFAQGAKESWRPSSDGEEMRKQRLQSPKSEWRERGEMTRRAGPRSETRDDGAGGPGRTMRRNAEEQDPGGRNTYTTDRDREGPVTGHMWS